MNFNAQLVLEDGRIFNGKLIKKEKPFYGEIIFNTSMTGYQEIITDPSYLEQMVVFTFPHIGNYGISNIDNQSNDIKVNGIIVKNLSFYSNNWRSENSFYNWVCDKNIKVIFDIDTRSLTRHIRSKGSMRGGVFINGEFPYEEMLNKVKSYNRIENYNLASRVSTSKKYKIENNNNGFKIAVLDFGVKNNILNELLNRNCILEIFPLDTNLEDILNKNFNGIVLSNGPGDPKRVTHGINLVKKLIGKIPILGICLGYQILALALGCKTYKMLFGHHGGNHPVLDINGSIWITAQNHGFAVDEYSLPSNVLITHRSLYDKTLEGFSILNEKIIAVQFHPESGPGPSDSKIIFERFINLL